ncbi:glycosyltransferase family 2 protein [Leeuwenhoekiella sp.]|uniref:glycosyltransferase family 2 protein n=1 Tax=Leeuwenhoekiella sp. TaxID=1977054 RepID=UPI003242247A
MDTIYVVILNYNSWQDTIECVESLLNSTYKNFQIILLDNKSPNDSEKKIRHYFEGSIDTQINASFFNAKIKKRNAPLPYKFYNNENAHTEIVLNESIKSNFLKYPIIFIQTNENLGFAGGNNVALNVLLSATIPDRAKVFLLNPDTFIETNCLEELSQITNDFFIAGCAIKKYEDPLKLSFYGGYRFFKPFGIIRPITNLRNRNKVDYIYGGALLTNIQTLRKNGLLPSEYFLYWEETDWSYKAQRESIELFLAEKAVVYDKVGTSTGRGYLAHYYYIRNGLKFYSKYLKHYLPTLIAFNVLRFLNKLRKGEWQSAKAIFDGSKDYFRGKEGYTPIG